MGDRYHELGVGTNSLDDLVLEDLMNVLEVITLEHVETMLTLMKIHRLCFTC